MHRKKIMICLLFAVFAIILYGAYYGRQLIAIGAAYKAKSLCSGIFISGRSPKDVEHDVGGALRYINADIDFERKSVATAFPGVRKQYAIFRYRLGCTLLTECSDIESLRKEYDVGKDMSVSSAMMEKPRGLREQDEDLLSEVSSSKLARVMDIAFSDKDHPVRTRAVVVVYKGRIIAERYAPGIYAETPLPGWSMTKSVTNALVGILVNEGKLSLDTPVSITDILKVSC